MREVFVCAAKGMLPSVMRDVSALEILNAGENRLRCIEMEAEKIAAGLPSGVRKGPFESQLAYKVIFELSVGLKPDFDTFKKELFFICAHSDPHFNLEYLERVYMQKMLSFSNISAYLSCFSEVSEAISPASRTTFLPMNALAQFLIEEKLNNGSACLYGDNSFAMGLDDAFWRISHADSDLVTVFGANELFLDAAFLLRSGLLDNILTENQVTNLLEGAFGFWFSSSPSGARGTVLRVTKSRFMDFPDVKSGDKAAEKMLSELKTDDYLLVVHNGVGALKNIENGFDTLEKFGYIFHATAGLNLFMALRRVGALLQKTGAESLSQKGLLVVSAGMKGCCHVMELEIL